MSSSPTAREAIEKILAQAGFDSFGFAELKRPITIGFYQEWLAKGHHADMLYLERHLPEKTEPQRMMKRALSAIVVTKNYVPHPKSKESWPLKSSGMIATYAEGEDYHYFLKQKMAAVIADLQALWPEEEFACFTDSAPVLERDLAVRAGLGWVGKNTCLISRTDGSLFFIAEIYSSLELPTAETQLSPDHCGTCRRCLDACPTGALVAPRELDARKCISYLTIESRDLPSESLREQIGPWLFGCDICQNVCPWNKKVLAKKPIKNETHQDLEDDLRFILSSSNRALERAFQGTPLTRAGGFGLKRNALIVAANLKMTVLVPEIKSLLSHERLGILAQWSLEKLLDAREPSI